MSPLSVRLVRAAFACLAGGILLGLCFAGDRSLGARWRFLHAELNLWGWATLLVYGMAYHMLPRFAGRPLRARVATAQGWLAMGGVALAAVGWLVTPLAPVWGQAGVMAGIGLQGAAALLFAAMAGELLWHGGAPS